MKVVLDFDDTIFDSRCFKADLMGIFAKYGISEDEFNASAYSKSCEGVNKYDVASQLKKLEHLKAVSLEPLRREIENWGKDLSGYVFQDFFYFIRELSVDNLVLLTFGDIEFQQLKVANSGLEKYFSRLLFTEADKGSVLKQYLAEIDRREEVFFIDDREEQLTSVARLIPNVHCLRMRREEGRYSGENSSFMEVEDLVATLDYLKAVHCF
jgi:FMN phosphatase YigB (HAD superfamily)